MTPRRPIRSRAVACLARSRAVACLARSRAVACLARSRTVACLTGLLLALAACTPGANLPPLPDTATTTYELGPNDQVRLITFGEDGLSEIFRVNDAGDIAIPLLGAVHATGLTTEQLGTRVATELRRRDLLKSPSVSVEVTEYRPVFVLGEVTKPGQYTYQPGMTVLSTVAIAGGYTYRAVDGYAAITRRIDGRPITGRVSPTASLRPGDIVTVFQRFF